METSPKEIMISGIFDKLLPPQLSVQTPIMNRFADRLGTDFRGAGQVSDGAGDFDDTVVSE